MANNYSRFSAEVQDLKQEEYEWLVKILTVDPEDLEKDELAAFLEEVGIDSDDLEWGWPPFDYQFENDGHSLWYYAEECFNVDAVGAFLHSLMSRFEREGRIVLTWADTCSKMRIDEFGGGILVATKDGWDSLHTCGLADNVEALIKNK